MNWLSCCGSGDIPLVRRGWTRHQEKVAKPPAKRKRVSAQHQELKERTGWSTTSYVPVLQFRNMTCERPPRLRRFGGFATLYYWRSHASSRGTAVQIDLAPLECDLKMERKTPSVASVHSGLMFWQPYRAAVLHAGRRVCRLARSARAQRATPGNKG